MGKPYVKKGKKLSKNLEYSMKTDYYPVEDYIPMKDRDDLNIVVRMDGEYYNLFGGLVPVKIWAVPTGEFRAPKRGESGTLQRIYTDTRQKRIYQQSTI